jgi:hypothetical protein
MKSRLNLLKSKLYQFLDIALNFLSYLNFLLFPIGFELADRLGVFQRREIAQVFLFSLLLCSVASILIAAIRLGGFISSQLVLINLIILIFEIRLAWQICFKPHK